MKIKSWLLSIAAAILLGGGIFGIVRYPNPSTVPPVQASVSTGEILSTILTSYTQWNTLQGEAQFTWYDNGGGKQIYSDKFVVSQPASAYIDITNLSQIGFNEGITISDGEAIYALDKAAKTYTRGSFSVKPDAVALLPRSLSQIQPGTVYAHPMAQIGVPILEYLYPSWWPQQKSGDTFVLSGTDKIVNRAVWVVDHSSTNGDRETAWVDQATGIILQFHQIIHGKLSLEMKMLDLQVDAPVASSWFVLPAGYSSANPIVTGNISTAIIKSGQTPQATATVPNPQPFTAPGKILIIDSIDQVTVSDPDGQNTHAYPVKPRILAASLSPDGKKVAYESEEQLSHVIFLLDLETGVSTQVSRDEILGDTEALLWTRAGDQLIFSATVGDSLIFQIYTLDLVSGVITPLTHFTTGSLDTWLVLSSWSLDESTIGFTTLVMPPTSGHDQGILQTLDVKSGEIKTILDEAHAGDIEWLGGTYLTPDGKSIFFEGRHNGHFRIFRIDVDGTHLTEVTRDDLPYDILGPIVFSPDGGSFFACAADQNKNNSNLVPTLFSINGDLIRQLSDVPWKVVSWIDIGK